jgi:hypothetical protein
MTQRLGWTAGLLAGAMAVPTFHQPVAAIFAALEMFPGAVFNLDPRPPLGLPALVNGMGISALWGVLFVGLWRGPLGRLPLWLAGALYGAVVPLGFLFLVLAPLRGAPIAFGMDLASATPVVVAHAAFGFGIACWLAALRHLGQSRDAATP